MHSILESLKKISISVGRTLLTGSRSFRIIGDVNRMPSGQGDLRVNGVGAEAYAMPGV
ncbi:hypothetical protein C5S42_12570 [Candidatus Methanomarinus sp.]|nr:hypothetical protein C5S42_12570 [ANME-2 cluster archaeon]